MEDGLRGELYRARPVGGVAFGSARSNSDFVGNSRERTLAREGLVWSATWGMPVNMSETKVVDSEDQGVLPPAAQTNLSLYKQLHGLGYAHAELTWVRDCYELATSLFAGHLRGSGKPFLAHLVGTASTLADVGAPPVAVVAGLIHAAYEQGDFGIARWRRRRDRVRAAIGKSAEELVWRYYRMPWSASEISRLQSNLGQVAETDRLVVLMRLANELEDNLDLAMLHSHAVKDAYRDQRDSFVALSRLIGCPKLANTFIATYREASENAWAAAMSLNRPASYQLASPFGLRLLKPTRRLVRLAKMLARATGR